MPELSARLKRCQQGNLQKAHQARLYPASEQRECEAKAGALIAAAQDAFTQNDILLKQSAKA